MLNTCYVDTVHNFFISAFTALLLSNLRHQISKFANACQCKRYKYPYGLLNLNHFFKSFLTVSVKIYTFTKKWRNQ